MLLDLARGLFEEAASLDAMMSQVMKEAQQLLPCEHCTVIILDQEEKEVTLCSHPFYSSYQQLPPLQNVVFTQAYQIEGFSDELTCVRHMHTIYIVDV